MKKFVILILGLFVMPIVGIQAEEPIPLTLNVSKIDLPIGSKPHPKSPIVTPTIYLEGHIIYFDDYFQGNTLQLIDISTEEIIYLANITSEMEIPEYICGTYLLQIIQHDYIYWSYVTFS